MKSLKDYLRDVHAKGYRGFYDEIEKDFEGWINWLDISDIPRYADEFVKTITK